MSKLGESGSCQIKSHLKEIAIIARYKTTIMRNKGHITINSYIVKYEVILWYFKSLAWFGCLSVSHGDSRG